MKERREKNRQAQASYRLRKKKREEKLELEKADLKLEKADLKLEKERPELELKEAKERLEQISREPTNTEAPCQSAGSVPPTIGKGRSRTPDTETQPSKTSSDLENMSEELFAPGLLSSCDMSTLFSQDSSQFGSDFFTYWEPDDGGLVHPIQDVTDDPKVATSLDRLQVDLNVQEDTAAGYGDQASRDISSQDTLSVAKAKADTMHCALQPEGTIQENNLDTWEDNAEPGSCYLTGSSLPRVDMNHISCLETTVPYGETGTGLTTWSGFCPLEFTLNPQQPAFQQVVYIFQNAMLFPNNLIGYAFYSAQRPLLV
ncbi:hypothetical protein KCU78_g1088, partial [Aureobasidium melanogenum]